IYYGLWLLANSNKSITAVAAESGFADPSHFNRLFRATFGCPPSVLRKESPETIRTIIQRRKIAGNVVPAAESASAPALQPEAGEGAGFLHHERRPYRQ